MRLHFHAAPGVAIRADASGVVRSAPRTPRWRSFPLPMRGMTVHDNQTSPLYGALLPSRSLALTAPAGQVDVVTAMVCTGWVASHRW